MFASDPSEPIVAPSILGKSKPQRKGTLRGDQAPTLESNDPATLPLSNITNAPQSSPTVVKPNVQTVLRQPETTKKTEDVTSIPTRIVRPSSISDSAPLSPRQLVRQHQPIQQLSQPQVYSKPSQEVSQSPIQKQPPTQQPQVSHYQRETVPQQSPSVRNQRMAHDRSPSPVTTRSPAPSRQEVQSPHTRKPIRENQQNDDTSKSYTPVFTYEMSRPSQGGIMSPKQFFSQGSPSTVQKTPPRQPTQQQYQQPPQSYRQDAQSQPLQSQQMRPPSLSQSTSRAPPTSNLVQQSPRHQTNNENVTSPTFQLPPRRLPATHNVPSVIHSPRLGRTFDEPESPVRQTFSTPEKVAPSTPSSYVPRSTPPITKIFSPQKSHILSEPERSISPRKLEISRRLLEPEDSPESPIRQPLQQGAQFSPKRHNLINGEEDDEEVEQEVHPQNEKIIYSVDLEKPLTVQLSPKKIDSTPDIDEQYKPQRLLDLLRREEGDSGKIDVARMYLEGYMDVSKKKFLQQTFTGSEVVQILKLFSMNRYRMEVLELILKSGKFPVEVLDISYILRTLEKDYERFRALKMIFGEGNNDGRGTFISQIRANEVSDLLDVFEQETFKLDVFKVVHRWIPDRQKAASLIPRFQFSHHQQRVKKMLEQSMLGSTFEIGRTAWNLANYLGALLYEADERYHENERLAPLNPPIQLIPVKIDDTEETGPRNTPKISITPVDDEEKYLQPIAEKIKLTSPTSPTRDTNDVKMIDPEDLINQLVEAERLIDHESIEIENELLVPAIDDRHSPVKDNRRVSTVMTHELDVEQPQDWNDKERQKIDSIRMDLHKIRANLLTLELNYYSELAMLETPSESAWNVLTSVLLVLGKGQKRYHNWTSLQKRYLKNEKLANEALNFDPTKLLSKDHQAKFTLAEERIKHVTEKEIGTDGTLAVFHDFVVTFIDINKKSNKLRGL